jgi:cellulose biosynthesis protein BcsQ
MMFDYVVIDCGDSLADTTLATLNISPTVFLVGTSLCRSCVTRRSY